MVRNSAVLHRTLWLDRSPIPRVWWSPQSPRRKLISTTLDTLSSMYWRHKDERWITLLKKSESSCSCAGNEGAGGASRIVPESSGSIRVADDVLLKEFIGSGTERTDSRGSETKTRVGGGGGPPELGAHSDCRKNSKLKGLKINQNLNLQRERDTYKIIIGIRNWKWAATKHSTVLEGV